MEKRQASWHEHRRDRVIPDRLEDPLVLWRIHTPCFLDQTRGSFVEAPRRKLGQIEHTFANKPQSMPPDFSTNVAGQRRISNIRQCLANTPASQLH